MVERHNQVQAIKDAIDVVDVIGQYTALAPAGKRLKGLSPFTNEKTPSFFVDPDAGVYYCFSSQKGGDIFSFIQDVEGVDFREALQMLAERAGIDLTDRSSGSSALNNTPLYHLLEAAAEVYRRQMTPTVKQYLIGRGISEQSIATWGIGYAPNDWNTLCTKQMPNLAEHVTAGMCIENKEKQSVYDRFRSRVQFPFYDVQGRVIGFSGRVYGDDDDGVAKYINSPESPLFNKSSFLYGLHIAKMAIRKHNFAILTEGPIDAIMVHQAGYPMAVATSGTAVTETHLRTLQRLSNRLLLLFDGDAAGLRAALRVIEMTYALGIDCKVVMLPDGSDPADVVAEDVVRFKQLVKEAVTATGFLIRYVTQQYGESGEDRIRGVKEAVLPVIAMSRDPMIREHAIKEVAEFCELSVEAIQESLGQVQGGAVVRDAEPALQRKKSPAHTQDRANAQEEKIGALLTNVAMARCFLAMREVLLAEPTKMLLDEVVTITALPEVDEEAVRIRYEEGFATTDDQTKGAQHELETTLKNLHSELKKQQELTKLNDSSSPT